MARTAPRTQDDAMDFDPEMEIPFPTGDAPLPGDDNLMSDAMTNQDMYNVTNPNNMADALLNSQMGPMDSGPSGPGPSGPEGPSFTGTPDSPAPPPLPTSTNPENPYATPGTRSSRPYRSPNLAGGGSFTQSQGFGAGGGEEGDPGDEDLINQIVQGLGKRR